MQLTEPSLGQIDIQAIYYLISNTKCATDIIHDKTFVGENFSSSSGDSLCRENIHGLPTTTYYNVPNYEAETLSMVKIAVSQNPWKLQKFSPLNVLTYTVRQKITQGKFNDFAVLLHKVTFLNAATDPLPSVQ